MQHGMVHIQNLIAILRSENFWIYIKKQNYIHFERVDATTKAGKELQAMDLQMA